MKKNIYTLLLSASLLLFSSFIFAQSNIRLLMVDPVLDRITIKNFGTTAADISDYRLCARFAYTPNLSGQSVVSGSLNLMPNAEVTLDITINLNAGSSDFGLYLPFSGFSGFANPNLMVDFTQWGAGGIGRESVAVQAGLWTAGDFIDPPGPYSYIGNGNQNGVSFWQNAAGGFDCPVIMANFGDPCDDADPCTINDMVQNDCSCAGTFQDSDSDGTCDANDLCPGGPEPGTACDDGDDCTINDEVQPDCSCAGTFQDSDSDGTCDANDLCPGGPEPGTACDDGDDCTINDEVQADCSCAGTFQDSDSDGTCDANDLCPGGPEPGTACDDGDDCTVNDEVQTDCSCAGTFQDSDDDGTCDANDLCPGGPEPGTACDDGDDCTINDEVQNDCSCTGTFQDSDSDGTCDANDLCPGGPEPGTACDDGDDCTINDEIQADCSCAGMLQALEADAGPDVVLNCILTSATLHATATGCDSCTFAWTTIGGNIVSGADTAIAIIDTAGIYIINITNEDTGCTAIDSVVVMQTNPVELTLDSSSNIACQGDSTGLAMVMVSGGVPPYSYDWSNNGTGPLQENLPAGSYFVTATDEDGCMDTLLVEILEPAALQIELSSFQNIACNGSSTGAARVEVMDGTPDYTYLWSNGSTEDFIQNVTAGTYTVSVTDANNCQDTLEVSLTEPPFLQLSISGADETALGAHDGIATPMIQGGVPPYMYNWSNGTEDEIAENLAPGTYQLTVMDQNGCSIMATVIINAFDCPTIFIDSEYTPLICPGSNSGSASIVAVPGANQPVSYNWSTGSADSTISNLPGGMYLVTITDSTNCAVIDVFDINEGDPIGPIAMVQNITVSLDENGLATITSMDIDDGSSDNCNIDTMQVSQSQFDCDDLGQRTVTLTVTDGIGNFSIATAIVSVLDDQVPLIENCPPDINITDCTAAVEFDQLEVIDNCEVSITLIEGLESGSIFPAGATDVVYEVEDGAGNQAVCAFTVTVESDLDFEATSTPVSCNGSSDGQIEIMPSGGTPPYSIMGNLDNLAVGTYSITVADNLGCTVTKTVVVTGPPLLNVAIDQILPETNMQSDGQIFITAAGGTGELTFNWTDQEGNDIGSTEDISGLAAGTYFVWVTDENDCFVIREVQVDQITGIKDAKLAAQISVFPNPNSGQFNIRTDLTKAENLSIFIFDVNGKKIQQYELGILQSHMLKIDLSNVQSGVYSIMCLVGEGIVYKRIIVSD